jgi:hypothetical protein
MPPFRPHSVSVRTVAVHCEFLFRATGAEGNGNLKFMQREPIYLIGTSDLSGHFRGKRFPAAVLYDAKRPWSAYIRFKRAEIAGLQSLDESEICRRYAEVY